MSPILVATVARLLFAVFAMQGPAAPAGVITGRILLSDGMPAVGMRVSAMLVPDSARPGAADAGALFSQTQTDENGRYRLEEIPAGRYYINGRTARCADVLSGEGGHSCRYCPFRVVKRNYRRDQLHGDRIECANPGRER
jgi:hypothetical protein